MTIGRRSAWCCEPALNTTLASCWMRSRTAAGGGASGERHACVADGAPDGDDQGCQELAASGGQTAAGGKGPVELLGGKTSAVVRRHVRRRGAVHSAPGVTGSVRPWTCPQLRRLQSERSVRPFLVVRADELGQYRRQVPLVEHDQVIQALAAKCAHHAFDDRVRTRCSNGRGDAVDTDAPSALAKIAAVDHVPIAQQMARLGAPRGRLNLWAANPRTSANRRC